MLMCIKTCRSGKATSVFIASLIITFGFTQSALNPASAADKEPAFRPYFADVFGGAREIIPAMKFMARQERDLSPAKEQCAGAVCEKEKTDAGELGFTINP